MKKILLISELDNIAVLMENDRAVEFFVNRGELLLGDIYTATVEKILPGIDAAFVNLGKDKMGFLHANDVPGTGPLKERLVPKQKLLVQITKEPTGHKGPRVSTAISLPGRFLVLVPEERGVSISRRISEAKERARLKAVVNLMKPPGVGLIIRTEAKSQSEETLFEDFETLWDRWQTIVSDGEASIGPTLIYRDQDLLYRVIRDAYSTDIAEIIVDSADGQKRAQDYMSGWAGRTTKVLQHMGEEPLLVSRAIDREIEGALSDRVELPSGGHLNVQPTEALTVIDVNSGRFTSSRTQAETVRRTNLEAANEIPRQLRLRNIGGMVIVDFIDMDSRRDQQQVLEVFQRALEDDRAKPQIGQLSDLGLVELTRRRQGQSLRELFTAHCATCSGLGVVPHLELGSGDFKRTLSVRPKDEDLVAKARAQGRGSRGGGRQQAGALRAVSAGSGRVKPILVEPDEAEEEGLDVPEEILEQMPDDLLSQAEGKSQHAKTNFAAGRLNLDDDVEDMAEEFEADVDLDDVDEDESPSVRFGVRNRFQTAATLSDVDVDLDDDDEEEDAPPAGKAPSGSPSISDFAEDLEEVSQDEGNGNRFGDEYASPGDSEPESQTEAVTDVLPITESPYETEVDPVTGVYRLKAKSSSPMHAPYEFDSQSESDDTTGQHTGQGHGTGYGGGTTEGQDAEMIEQDSVSFRPSEAQAGGANRQADSEEQRSSASERDAGYGQSEHSDLQQEGQEDEPTSEEARQLDLPFGEHQSEPHEEFDREDLDLSKGTAYDGAFVEHGSDQES
jgi:Rne/Rng family ribonuclease